MRRTFYLIDAENGNRKKRITRQFIVDHFNSTEPPFRYNWAKIDLERFRFEMEEIGCQFKIVTHRRLKHG